MKKNLQIEGLRGCCVVIVAFFHIFCRFSQVYLSKNISLMQHWGDFGVTVFLLISSYFLFPLRDTRGISEAKKISAEEESNHLVKLAFKIRGGIL